MTLTDPRSDRALVQTNASSVVDIARQLREDLRAIDELRRRGGSVRIAQRLIFATCGEDRIVAASQTAQAIIPR